MLYFDKWPSQPEAGWSAELGLTSNINRLQTMARCFSIVAACEILMDFISPAMWIMTAPQSIMAKVANLSTSGIALGMVWLLAALLVVPFVLMQFFNPEYRHRRAVIKICNAGNLSGAFIWFFMGFLARNLDYEFIIFNFILNGFGALVMAALLANSLNNDQIESALMRPKAGQ